MKKLLSLKFGFVLLIVVFTFFACSPKADNGDTGGNEKVNQNLKVVTQNGGILHTAVASNENGGYDLFLSGGNSANVVYYDYKTAQKTYLADDTASTHGAESPSYIENIIGGASPFLHEDKLYIMKLGSEVLANLTGDESMLLYIMRMDLDGANKKKYMVPPQYNYMPGSAIAANEKYMYFAMYTIVDYKNDIYSPVILSMDIETGVFTEVVAFEQETNVNILGVYDYGLVLAKDYKNADVTMQDIITLDLNANEQTVLKTYRRGEISKLVHNNILYFARADADFLFSLDVATGEEAVVADSEIDDKYFSFVLLGVFDNRIMFYAEKDASGYQDLLAFDMATSKASKIELTYKWFSDTRAVTVVAEADTQFLVYVGDEAYDYMSPAPGGKAFKDTQYIRMYKLINKSDYWAGIPNYIEFEDKVLK